MPATSNSYVLTVFKLAFVSLALWITSGCSTEAQKLARDDDQPKSGAPDHEGDAAALLEAAISAHGADALEKLDAGIIQFHLLGYNNGKLQDENNRTCMFVQPDKLSDTTEIELAAENMTLRYVRNGGQAWKAVDNAPFKRTLELRSVRDINQFRIIEEMKMLQDISFVKTLRDDVVIDGRKYAVVTIMRDDQFIAENHFDKTTGLLAKIRINTWNPTTGRMAKSESYYTNYKSFGGVMIATKIKDYFDGQIFNEKSVTSFKLLDTIDENQFSTDSN